MKKTAVGKHPNTLVKLLRSFYATWTAAELPMQAAALAFFTIFTIAPMLVVIIEIVGIFPGYAHHAIVRNRIFETVGAQAGKPVAAVMRSLVDASFARSQHRSWVMAAIGWAAMLFAATGLFGTIQGALDKIWEVKQSGGVLGAVKERALAFGLLVGLAVLTVVWLAVGTVVAVFVKTLPPGTAHAAMVGDTVVEWLVFAIALGLLFKLLPRASLAWRPALVGGGLTAAMIVLGQFAIGVYLNRSTSGSAYGIATAFVALALWIYYSAQLFLAGAALTKVLSPAPADAAAP